MGPGQIGVLGSDRGHSLQHARTLSLSGRALSPRAQQSLSLAWLRGPHPLGMDVRTQQSKPRAGFGVRPTSLGSPALPLTYSVILGKKLHRVL